MISQNNNGLNRQMENRNKKIVVICPYLFRLTRGIERFCISLSKSFTDKGYEVIIYAWGNNNETSCDAIDKRIRVRKVPYFRWHQEKMAIFFYRLWLLLDNPQATILNFLYHGEICLPHKRKYLYVLHSPASQIPGRYEFIKQHICKFKNIHIVAVSKMVEEEARPYIGDTPMSLIYNGTDTLLFRPSKDKINNGKLNIITAAAFEERKGMHYMIESLADFPYRNCIHYDIYGNGDIKYGQYLESLIRKYHLENTVFLKGCVSNISEIEPKYDLLAFLSKGEAFGLAITEAMACGLPVLTSDCPPFPEFVKPSFGRMVNRESVKEIQDFLTELIENRNQLSLMGNHSLNESKQFSWDNIVNQYIKLIKQ